MTTSGYTVKPSWIEVPDGSDFPLNNLPYGIYSEEGTPPHACTRIGDTVIDLHELCRQNFLPEPKIDPDLFARKSLNDFIALGKPVWKALREELQELFDAANSELRDNTAWHPFILKPADRCTMHLPVQPGDYTDFYSSIEHATNVGMMFRDPANALLPNWRHLPVGYHGRSSSIVVSGTPVHRPKGQTKPDDAPLPQFGPTSQCDFELEMAFIAGKETPLGSSVSIKEAEDNIFGLVLFNDLSARDIQKWEYVPLGPFLAKNFGSVISPWVVTLEALEPFRVAGPVQEPAVLPYLQCEGNHNFDINLEVFIRAHGGPEHQIGRASCRERV